MGKVVCFGELLLRLVPSADGRWLTESSVPVYVGGAEANVAVALANWGIPANYFSCVPANFLGEQLVVFLNQKNVETSKVMFSGEKLGTYYIPEGTDLKNAGVIYDRASSSFYNLKTGLIDWEKVLEDADWFHFSAISPALNQNVADVCFEGLEYASRKGIKVSVDLNYRAKLWQYGKKPLQIMPCLVAHCDLIMGNIWATETMLGIPIEQGLISRNEKAAYLTQAKNSSQEVLKKFEKCKSVANTFRFTEDNQNINYYTTLYDERGLFVSEEYKTNYVVDKVGSGDCFMAGLIYGFIQKLPPQELIEFATAAAFQKLFVKGDSTNKSVEEIKNSIKKHEYKGKNSKPD